MATYFSYIGTGLYQGEEPFATAEVFGVDLNDVDTSGWSANPAIVGETDEFDLSTITVNHEVVVALCKIFDTPGGLVDIAFVWHDSSHNVIYNSHYASDTPPGSTMFGYSYIGWVAGEITANATYHVHIDVTLAGSYSATKTFDVIGISDVAVGIPGHIWIDSIAMFFLDELGVRRAAAFTATGNTGVAGHVWVEGTYLHYIDGAGNERRFEGFDPIDVSGVPGYLWLDGGSVCFIDSSGYKRNLYFSEA